MEPSRADRCARLFADTDRDGVYSHGLNRFPRFVRMIRSGVVDVRAQAVPVDAHHGFERWNGQGGPGNLNALACMQRAIDLATRRMASAAWGWRTPIIGCAAAAMAGRPPMPA